MDTCRLIHPAHVSLEPTLTRIPPGIMDNPLLLPKSARDPYANPARDYRHGGAATDQLIAVHSGFLRESLRGLWTILEMQTLPCVPYTNPYGVKARCLGLLTLPPPRKRMGFLIPAHIVEKHCLIVLLFLHRD